MIDLPQFDAKSGRKVRAFVKALFAFSLIEPDPPSDGVLVVIGQDPPPLDTEFSWMAKINVGDLLPITISGLREDPENPGQMIPGELAGTPSVTVQDGAILELIEDTDENPSTFKVRGLAQGPSTVTAVATNPSGKTLTIVGLVLVNDPADDATILEMEFGEPETPAPVEEPSPA